MHGASRDDTRQEGRNLEGQVELGEAYARQRGYSIVAVITGRRQRS